MVSVVDQLRDPSSTLVQVLDELLPKRHVIVDRWKEHLRHAPCAATRMGGDWAIAGKAIEIRIGLDLAKRPVHWDALNYLAPEQCERLLASAGYRCGAAEDLDPLLRTWERHTRPTHTIDDEAHLEALVTCYTAAYRAGLGFQIARDMTVAERRVLADIMGATDPKATDRRSEVDLQTGLALLWQRYETYGRPALLALGDRVLASAPIANGHGEADLIVGRTIVDIKVVQFANEVVDLWLGQVLTYALLDRLNAFALTGVAIYAAWQGVLLQASLEEVVAAAASQPTATFSDLRDRFSAAMADDLDDAEWRRNHFRYPPPSDAWTIDPGPE